MASAGEGFPTSLIRKVQISLRQEAGVASFHNSDVLLDPHDNNSSSTISELIEGFDPSIPSYLRCKQCRGGLLRGVQSIVCVYCGAQQRNQIPPDSIPFKSTFSYAWFLQSLGLNGLEAIIASTNGDRDSSKGRNMSKNESVLADLFDLELKWSAELKESESTTTDNAPFQSKSSLNLAGVDLDNFFIEPGRDATSVPKEPVVSPKNEIKSTESHVFPSHESISLFDSAQSSNVAVRTSKTNFGVDDTLSGWEAEFRSASSRTLTGNSKLHDPFVIPSIVDSLVSPDTNLNISNSLASDLKTENDLFSLASIGEPKKNTNRPAYTSDSWSQDDLWPSGDSRDSKNEKIYKRDDSIVSSDGTSGSGNTIREMEVGDVLQADLFSGVTGSDRNFMQVYNMQETPISNRDEIVGVNINDSKCPTDGDESSNTSMQINQTKLTEVESLMSQMHDLSFMLDTNLSVPKQEH